MTKFGFIYIAIAIAIAISCPLLAADSPDSILKSWTHVNGNSAVLTLIECDGDKVSFLKSDGNIWTMPVAHLVPSDRRVAERLVKTMHRHQTGYFVSSHMQADDEVMDSPSDLDALDDLESATDEGGAVSVIDQDSPPEPVAAGEFNRGNFAANSSPKKLPSLHTETTGSIADQLSSCDSCSVSNQQIFPYLPAVVTDSPMCCEAEIQCCEFACCEILCCPQSGCCQSKRMGIFQRLLQRLACQR